MSALEAGEEDPREAFTGLRNGRVDTDAGVDDAYARAVWSVLVEPGASMAGALIASMGGAEGLCTAFASEEASLRQARARWMPRLHPAAITGALTAAHRARAILVVPGDEEWPAYLDDLGVHAPVALWRRGGDAAEPHRPSVALVGARASTAYGEAVAADLAADLPAAGVTIVAGAAYGIDGASHRAVLSTGGRTLEFLAGGADRAYPRGHENLLARIATSGGVWSETPCGAAPTKWRFLSQKRNRVRCGSDDGR